MHVQLSSLDVSGCYRLGNSAGLCDLKTIPFVETDRILNVNILVLNAQSNGWRSPENI
jgi:hypothetical protein